MREAERRGPSRRIDLDAAGHMAGNETVDVDKKFKVLLAPPCWSRPLHGRARYGTACTGARRGRGAWEDGGGIAHGIATHRGGRDTYAAHTSPLRLHGTAWA
jgi:hypothetical protein